MMDDWRNIWVIALYENNEHSMSLLKLLGYARLLGDNAGSWVEVLMIGKNITEEMGKELIQYGADNVYIVSNENIEIFNVEQVSKLIEKVVMEKKPQFILMPDNKLTRAIAGYLSGKLGSPAITEAIKLDIDPYEMKLRGSKPVFEGQLLAVLEATGGYPQIATVKPLLYSLPFKDEFRSGRVNKLEVNLGELDVKTSFVGKEKAEPIPPHNWKSKVVVAIGEEVGDKEKFDKAVSVLEKFEIYVGGTKTAVDKDIAPRERLLGPMGKIIRPDLLITIGSQHAPEPLYGYPKKPHTLAIAKDTNYPIVKESRYYAIGDAAELTELLIKEFENILNK
ncbi:MAG: electron transfer flavoprotein subunit alpha/FixB family protein [Candidatus Njordarchaeia archaeon]